MEKSLPSTEIRKDKLISIAEVLDKTWKNGGGCWEEGGACGGGCWEE